MNEKERLALIVKLHDYMAKKGLKRYELANALGTTAPNVTNWLNGKRKISMAWAELIKARLGWNAANDIAKK